MSSKQWLRKCTLLVSQNNGDGLDLSKLRIKFLVKRSDTQTPNMAEIRVYNLEINTARRIRKEFSKVVLQAGYEENFGVIFQGNIKQVILGRESGVDTFIDIIAGDGDLSYNFAIVNQSLAAGAGQQEQIAAAIGAMTRTGETTQGPIGELPPTKLPRGKVMYGMARDYLEQSAITSNKTWSIQDGKVQFVSVTSYLPGEVVQLNSKTGMVGTPQQTNEGINVSCFLNPKLKVSGRVQLNNDDVARLKIDLSQPNNPANIPAPITEDGVYYILVIEHMGDTRGNDFLTRLTCLNLDVTANPINAVQVGY